MATTTARAIAAANGKEPALDLTVKSDPESLGGAARRPRAADRHGANHRARHDHCAAGLRRRRVVGAGCRGRAAGALARRRRRPARRRSVRGAGRQDRAAHQCGRARHRGRSRAGTAQPAARKSDPPVACGRACLRRCRGVASRAVRCRAPRCAMFVNRHHPPPPRHTVAQACRQTSPSLRPFRAG